MNQKYHMFLSFQIFLFFSFIDCIIEKVFFLVVTYIDEDAVC